MGAIGKITFILTGFLIVIGFYFMSFVNSQIREVEKKVEIMINNQIIIADLAVSPDERQRGLSGRASLNINEGMFFVFEEAGYHGIWMKDMKIPIDIIWINSEREIVGVESHVLPPRAGTPDSELKIYYPPEPVDRILEISAGRSELLRANPGDKVEIGPLIRGN